MNQAQKIRLHCYAIIGKRESLKDTPAVQAANRQTNE